MILAQVHEPRLAIGGIVVFLLVIAVFILAVIGIVKLAKSDVKLGRLFGALLFVGGVIVVGMFGLAILWLSLSHSSRESAPTPSIVNARHVVQPARFDAHTPTDWIDSELGAPIGGGSAWLDEVEMVHQPTVYASRERAALGLGRQITRSLRRESWADDVTLKKVLIFADSTDVKGDAQRVQSALNEQMPNVAIEQQVDARSVDQDAADICRITLSMSSKPTQAAPWAGQKSGNRRKGSQTSTGKLETRGVLEAHVSTLRQKRLLTAEFVSKPWVENYSSFLNSQPGIPWIKSLSFDLLAINQHEARRQAANAAAQAIAKRVHAEATRMAGGRSPVEPASAIVAHVQNELVDGAHVVDEFSQELLTDEGRVWRHALLVSYTPDELRHRASQALLVGRAGQVRRVAGMASALGLTFLTTVMYLFLNAVTKGYYRGTLIVGGLLVILVGGAAIFAIIA